MSGSVLRGSENLSKRFKHERPHLPPLPLGNIGKISKHKKTASVSKEESKAQISNQAGSEHKLRVVSSDTEYQKSKFGP